MVVSAASALPGAHRHVDGFKVAQRVRPQEVALRRARRTVLPAIAGEAAFAPFGPAEAKPSGPLSFFPELLASLEFGLADKVAEATLPAFLTRSRPCIACSSGWSWVSSVSDTPNLPARKPAASRDVVSGIRRRATPGLNPKVPHPTPAANASHQHAALGLLKRHS
jgi:hypothetical protein